MIGCNKQINSKTFKAIHKFTLRINLISKRFFGCFLNQKMSTVYFVKLTSKIFFVLVV